MKGFDVMQQLLPASAEHSDGIFEIANTLPDKDKELEKSDLQLICRATLKEWYRLYRLRERGSDRVEIDSELSIESENDQVQLLMSIVILELIIATDKYQSVSAIIEKNIDWNIVLQEDSYVLKNVKLHRLLRKNISPSSDVESTAMRLASCLLPPKAATEELLKKQLFAISREKFVVVGGRPVKFFIKLGHNVSEDMPKDRVALWPSEKIAGNILTPPQVKIHNPQYQSFRNTPAGSSKAAVDLLKQLGSTDAIPLMQERLSFPPHKGDSFLSLPRWLEVQVAQILARAREEGLIMDSEGAQILVSDEVSVVPGPLLKALTLLEHYIRSKYSELPSWGDTFRNYVESEVTKGEDKNALETFDPLGYLVYPHYPYALRLLLLFNSRKTLETEETKFQLSNLFDNYQTYNIYEGVLKEPNTRKVYLIATSVKDETTFSQSCDDGHLRTWKLLNPNLGIRGRLKQSIYKGISTVTSPFKNALEAVYEIVRRRLFGTYHLMLTGQKI